MARPRTAPAPEEPTAEEQERVEAEAELRRREPEPQPGLALARLDEEVLAALAEPLDRGNVKSRQGRGSSSFDYLETHFIKRTANRIFGVDGWGYTIVEQERIGEQQIEKESNGRKLAGWHVAYRCVVRVWVRGCPETEGSGYGDGVEYGPAARLTSSELAIKESESDALKRAFTRYGDQFGLILYAKGDDQARLERDQNADLARSTRSETPMSMEEVLGRLATYVEEGQPWIREAVETLYPEIEFDSMRKLDQTQRIDLLKRMQVVIYALESSDVDLADPDALSRQVRAAFLAAFDGAEILGPDPFRGPIPF